MKSQTENSQSDEQGDKQVCASHEWQLLFSKPLRDKHFREYMVHGYADFRQCSKCGAVGMAADLKARHVYLLSDDSAQDKKRSAAIWNARMAEPEMKT
jgi:hypothetical protein